MGGAGRGGGWVVEGVNSDDGGGVGGSVCLGGGGGFVGGSDAKNENRTPATQKAITTKCQGVHTYHGKKTALVP